MAQSLVEGLAGGAKEVADRYIVDVHAQGECVDKHTNGVGNLQVRTTAADRAEIHLTVVGIARYHIGCGCQEQMGRRDFLLAAENSCALEVGHANLFANPSLLIGLRQVGGNLAGTLASL